MTTPRPGPPPPQPRRSRHSILINQLGAAKADMMRVKARYDALAARARIELGLGDHVAGTTEVTVIRNRTWDKQRAQKDFGDAICSMAPDMKLARFVMTGEQFESYYVEGTPRVFVHLESEDE